MIKTNIEFKQVQQVAIYPLGSVFTFSSSENLYTITDYVITHDSNGEVISLVYVCTTNMKGTPINHKISQQRLDQAKAVK